MPDPSTPVTGRPAGEEQPPILELDGVTKSFGDLTVLDGMDLTVSPSEKVVLIGPSGSGKSTILRLAMTLETPDSGILRIDGEEVWRMPKGDRMVPANEAHLRRMRRKAGMIFQHFNLFPHMSVLRNVTEAPIHVLGHSKEEARQAAGALLEQVGLGDKADAYPSQLSGGQKQRVAIARALAMEPEILLLDEVTSALDPELVGEVLAVLRHLVLESRMTMLLVTHQMHFAREIADRVVFLDGGKVVEEGEPEALLSNPREPRTREFLSSLLAQ